MDGASRIRCVHRRFLGFAPADRRFARPKPVRETRALSWIVPIIVLVLLTVLALLTLPKAPVP
jgi:hypothetical protein